MHRRAQVALTSREWLEAKRFREVHQTARGPADHESTMPKTHIREFVLGSKKKQKADRFGVKKCSQGP